MAPSSLVKLIAAQTARVADLERLKAKVEEAAQNNSSRSIFEARRERLTQLWDKARQTNEEIGSFSEASSDPYTSEDIYGQFDNSCSDLLDRILQLIGDVEAISITDSSSVPQTRIEGEIDFLSVAAKYPKFDLPKFSGNYDDWASFCDVFSSLVHNVKGMPNVTKLRYLQCCLTGPAAEFIKDTEITNANYMATWSALEERYANVRIIVNKHVRALRELPQLKKESAEELRAFSDACQRRFRALGSLRMPIDQGHWLILDDLSRRLDPVTRNLWESELSRKDRKFAERMDEVDPLERFPTIAEFTGFLEERSKTLLSLAPERRPEETDHPRGRKLAANSKRAYHAHTRATSAPSGRRSTGKAACPLCSEIHYLGHCPAFLAKAPPSRQGDLRRLQLCFNCLGAHTRAECPSKHRCNVCQGLHHTLIHCSLTGHNRPPTSVTKGEESTGGAMRKMANTCTTHIGSLCGTVVLATARVTLVGTDGSQYRARALLDQGSEVSFVTERMAQLLGLPKQRTNISIFGVGASSGAKVRSTAILELRAPHYPEFQIRTTALVLPKLTANLPTRNLYDVDMSLFSDLQLADPKLDKCGRIDLLLGADIYSQILRPGLQHFHNSPLVAQNTVWGWIVSGPTQSLESRRADIDHGKPIVSLHCLTDDALQFTLQQFWAREEVAPPLSRLSPEDEACERQFSETHFRDSNGRYTVRLPLKSKPPNQAWETRHLALGSLTHLHRRFERDPRLKEAYCEFMDAYEQLGHMERVPLAELNKPEAWYLPHHAVVRTSPWKLRVVFDASRRTGAHHCLNQFLHAGPTLQSDLSLILLNWRRYRYVFTADIVKMFRQIGMHSDDRDFQRILWTPTKGAPPIDYRLTTVTYGTACAPFLAIRTLSQLAQDGQSSYPLGAHCLLHNTYVDDTFSGHDDLATATQIKEELINLLNSAGIQLDKWAANDASLLPQTSQRSDSGKAISTGDFVKALGVLWNPSTDAFQFSIEKLMSSKEPITKRSIASYTGRLFDPLGWLAPISVVSKILLQDLWLLKCDWDAPLPEDIRERWSEYTESLNEIPSISIPRWLGESSSVECQLHGFADASSRAFAAAVYLRVPTPTGGYQVSILSAKSKVAPVQTMSIPNLELCGASLLVKLICHLQKIQFFKGLPVFAWSDSKVVLAWLQKHPCHWKTFVANRVSYIQTELPAAQWSHVPTKENPADLATRGVKPCDLKTSDLWWRGPWWLSQSPERWPHCTDKVVTAQVRVQQNEHPIITKFSRLSRLVRVMAYCLRPLLKLRQQRNQGAPYPPFLTAAELEHARTAAVRLVQATAFSEEITLLRDKKPLPKRHHLSRLNPFVDEAGVIRVGGRLHHSPLANDAKHPPILPKSSHLSLLFARQAHLSSHHGGPTLTQGMLQQSVWILGSLGLVKDVVRKCIICKRAKPRLAQQRMGDLPSERVTPARPFTNAGLDYAGPFQIRTTKGRGYKAHKGYIALFVCFATRAIHLEVVSDLTSASFIAAYRRFAGRRGICRRLFSDNGTTFQGAAKELKEMFNAASKFYQEVAATLANDGTNWTFIPPSAPHYGGLWEAGVKSTKHHLKRVIGDTALTFEGFSTLLIEIEACLNSRPLCPMSSDPEDLSALTPAHFLIGETLSLLPDSEPPSASSNSHSRYQILGEMRNNYWHRWSQEYLHHLQERAKWRDPTQNFAVGQLVIIKDERYPPSKWPLGRITQVHPGPDGLVRVATVKTATSVLRRHIAKLSPLFNSNE